MDMVASRTLGYTESTQLEDYQQANSESPIREQLQASLLNELQVLQRIYTHTSDNCKWKRGYPLGLNRMGSEQRISQKY